MVKSFCPYVGALDSHDNQQPPVDYPSFENHCLASDSYEPVLLTDQATFCLSSGHCYCPRYQAAISPDVDPAMTPEQPPVWEAMATSEPELPPNALNLADFDDDPPNDRRIWGWVGAGIIFLSVFLCGGVFAAYTGWQMASHSLITQSVARINTVSSSPTAAPPVYIVLTATNPAPVAPPGTAGNAVAPTTTFAFPVAITPTPIVVSGQQVASAPDNAQPIDATPAPTAESQLNTLPTLPPSGQATPAVDVNVEIPTRRPTPILELPTSTPGATETPPPPTLTPTPTLPPGTPVVQFGPVDQQLLIGTCTVVQWHVENVRSVYYENQPVQGDGSQEECIKRNPKTYKLAIVLFDGSTKVYSTTVVPLFPTKTVTPTPSFTPESIPTATWTPLPPTPTPTPNVHYATTLAIQGNDPHTCSPDTTCEIGVLVTNSGDTTDNIMVAIVQSGPWSPELCRADNVCSSSNLSINGMGPANTAFIKFMLKVPANAAGQQASYGLRSVSNGSNGTVMSEIATVAVEAK